MSTFKTVIAILVMTILVGCGTETQVGNQVQLTPSNVLSATTNQTPNGISVRVELTSSVQERFAEVTSANIGRYVKLVIGGEVVSRSMVQGAINTPYIEIGCDSPEKAQLIMKALQK